MTHPGTPCIYYDHFYDLNDELNQLSEIRDSIENFQVEIKDCSAELYEATIDDKILIRIGNHNGGDGKNVLFQSNRVIIAEL